MTGSELYREALARAGVSSHDPGAFDISCLMEETCGMNRFQLALHGDEPVPETKAAAFFRLLEQWRQGEPLQYLLGKWEFYGLPFFVGPGVLIPRQDTETLAEEALRFLQDRRRPVVADVCAGSGCLACTIAVKAPCARVYAVELSEQALVYLRRNVKALHTAVAVVHGDAFSPPGDLPRLDLIVCNPPYISRRELETLEQTVRREPEMALLGGEDGYDFYRRLPDVWRPRLKPDGALMFETGYNQARTVERMLRDGGFSRTWVLRDPAGIERVVAACV